MELFLAFFKIGLFTFGGGYGMLSLIEDICVDRKKWITHDEMMAVTVIAESTPGPIAINCSTYVGYKQKGIMGAIEATVGVILPSFLVIFLISNYLNRFLEITWIANAFKGIKIAVGILILNVAVRMIVKMKKDVLSIIILICAAAVMLSVNFLSVHVSSITLLLAAGAVALAVTAIRDLTRGGRRA